MVEIGLLGFLLGIGAALSVGPIFVTIVQEAATRGFASAFRVILGSLVADLVLLVPAVAFSWFIAGVAGASAWLGLAGMALLLYLGWDAAVTARKMWRGQHSLSAPSSWSFWKGLTSNLMNPLSWTFWLATGTPSMLWSYEQAGWLGVAAFTFTWFTVAVVVELAVAIAVARSRRRLGPKGLAVLNALAAATFVALAGVMLAHSF
ncbi:MAG TPA: LysE family transporter [Pirellulales bacterium]|jgi:threonine/homoserine/homoserine lactone efflux protein|nr:LysE family transporter [Pirellulales bacterium]